MQNFAYERATTLPAAIAAIQTAAAMPLAGGTELLNWMKEGIATPNRLVDIGLLPGLDRIEATEIGLRIGALARMSDVAAHEDVLRFYPAIAEALLKSASQQIRNVATMGGNLMQRNRCPYFRAETELSCNKRRPGSGCAAIAGADRFSVIFGRNGHCIAPHASDLAVALAAFDAGIHVDGPRGQRVIPFADFYLPPGTDQARETALDPGELIIAITVPASGVARRSHYLKIRERASYEFALVSAAVGIDAENGRIREVRIALGGVAPKPWRLHEAEKALAGVALADEAALLRALDAGFADAQAGLHNEFKIELARHTALRAIQIAGERA